jgi:hypothetical protein
VAEQLGPLAAQASTAIVEEPRATVLAPGYYGELREALESELREASCRLSPGLGQAARSLRGLLANLDVLIRALPLTALEDRFAGRPGVVLAAGATPSMEEAARQAGAVTAAVAPHDGADTRPHLLLVPADAPVPPATDGGLTVVPVHGQLEKLADRAESFVVANTADEPGRLATSLLGPVGTLRARLPLAAAAELLVYVGACPVLVAGLNGPGARGSFGISKKGSKLLDELESLGLQRGSVGIARPDQDLLCLLGPNRPDLWGDLDATLAACLGAPRPSYKNALQQLVETKDRTRHLALAAARAGWRLDSARDGMQAPDLERLLVTIEHELMAPSDLLGLIECLRPLETLEAELAEELEAAGARLGRAMHESAVLRSGPRLSRTP